MEQESAVHGQLVIESDNDSVSSRLSLVEADGSPVDSEQAATTTSSDCCDLVEERHLMSTTDDVTQCEYNAIDDSGGIHSVSDRVNSNDVDPESEDKNAIDCSRVSLEGVYGNRDCFHVNPIVANVNLDSFHANPIVDDVNLDSFHSNPIVDDVNLDSFHSNLIVDDVNLDSFISNPIGDDVNLDNFHANPVDNVNLDNFHSNPIVDDVNLDNFHANPVDNVNLDSFHSNPIVDNVNLDNFHSNPIVDDVNLDSFHSNPIVSRVNPDNSSDRVQQSRTSNIPDVCNVDIVDIDVSGVADNDVRPGSVGHLLQLVRALANNLPSTTTPASSNSDTTGGGSASGLINLGFEDNETMDRDHDSDSSSNEEIDWSWLADETQLCAATAATATPDPRPSSWLRASMRRVRRFALRDPQPQQRILSASMSSAQPVIVPAVRSRSLHIPDILNSVPSSSLRPSAPPPPASTDEETPSVARSPDDFPRRYSLLGRLDGTSPVPEPTLEVASEPTTEDESISECEDGEEKEDCWPHALSSLLASLGCTLGLFNVSRFAILSIHFGANFVVQFLMLSTVIGWPLYVLHASLGQHLKSGIVDMWKISPLFQGIGIALLLSQAMLGLYSVVGVAWLFTYFRDSFINKYDAYRWAENDTKIEDSVSEYLNLVVLQRQGSSPVGHLKFQVTFNLAVVWMIVFVCLSKGIKSYGKSVHLFGTLPIIGIFMLAIKILTITDVRFKHTAWSELFVNANCWAAAAIECFTTWGLLGAATMQMRSHSNSCRLSRETLTVAFITIATLVSAALIANGFTQLLYANDLRYVPSSFENKAMFLSALDTPRLSSTPVRWMSHGHYVVGLQVTVPGTPIDTFSGYQVAQFATELAPAVFAKLGPQVISPFWTVLFYFTLLMLGISQQLCIWHCVITGVMAINIQRLRSWETTITFLSCACGFVLGLPMTTELGVLVVFFMDYCVGGAWWLILLQVAQIIAALMAQGGEQVAQTLLGTRRTWLQAIVVFTWNVVLPVSLTVISVSWFKTNNYRDLYTSRHHGYWPAWARRLGCLIQLVPLIIVPLVSAIQTWRYLTNGPPDLFDRLRLLCRPGLSSQSSGSTTTPIVSAPSQTLPELAMFDDPPPKYTPPPSYATATGARIAKLLRRSFRRLVGTAPAQPPDYSAVLVEMGGAQIGGRTSTLSAMEVAHILRSSMRRTLRREQTRSAPSTAESSKEAPQL